MRDRLMRDGFVVLALVFVVLRLLGVEPWVQSVDAYAYWATRWGDLYAAADTGRIGSYLYSPAFAQLLAPIVWLPWQVFVALWTALLLIVYRGLAERFALPLLLFLPIPFEIVSGNIHLLYAAVIVAGFRYPALWAFPLLTKVTPGVGLIWFAVRREWRSLALAGGATAAIAAVSWMLAPADWGTWFEVLRRDANAAIVTTGPYLPVPLIVRLPLAAGLVAWGALTERRWTVPVGVTLALPVVWLNSLAVLVALVPLLVPERRRVDLAFVRPVVPSGVG